MKTLLVRCLVVLGVLGLAAGAWAQQPVPPPASQDEVNTGADAFKYVTPATLSGYSLNQSTGSISAATATNIAVAASEIRDTTLSNVLSARLIATNSLLGTTYTNADTVVSNGLSARLIATNANLQPIDSDLTAIAGLGDPNSDRLLFWDDSAGSFSFLSLGSGLSISGTTITASGGGGGGTGMQNPARADFQVANYSLLDVDTIYGNDGAHGADLSLHSYDSDSTIKLYTFDSGNGIQYASQVGHTFTGPVTFNDGVTSGGTWSFATIRVTDLFTGITNAAGMSTDSNGKLQVGSGGGTTYSNAQDNAYSFGVVSNFTVGGLSTFSNMVSLVSAGASTITMAGAGNSYFGVGVTNGTSTNTLEVGWSGRKDFWVGTNGNPMANMLSLSTGYAAANFIPATGMGKLVVSNAVLYFVTNTKTNLISDGR